MDTILLNKEQKQRIIANSEHPLFYFKAKNYFLDNLSQGIQTKDRVGELDLRRNVHVNYLTKIYEKKKQVVEQQQRELQRYLRIEQFDTIFDVDQEIQKQKQLIEFSNQERQRLQMYTNFIENYEEVVLQEKPEVAIINIYQHHHEKDAKLIQAKQQDLKLLNREIETIKSELEQETKKINQNKGCKNLNIIQKVSSSIISSYMAYFDEIFNQLIDQILVEQVQYLNGLQMQQQNKTKFKSKQQEKLINILKQLDELGYDQ